MSLTAAMFVFQACYGTMDSYYEEVEDTTESYLVEDMDEEMDAVADDAGQTTSEQQ